MSNNTKGQFFESSTDKNEKRGVLLQEYYSVV